MRRRKATVFDLFAGSGGLSLGLRRSGFRISLAVEINRLAAATFKANHPGTHVIEADIRNVTAEEMLRSSRGVRPDLVVGCAPCQGFCSLTSKYRREDPRNELLLEMARLIKDLEPDAVMMENVPGIATRGATIFRDFLQSLNRSGYLCTYGIVQMADYGVPQTRRRFVLLAGRGFVIPFPEPTHSRLAQPENRRRKWVSVRQAIGGKTAPVALGKSWASGGPRACNWHIVRDLKGVTRTRLKAAMPGKTWLNVAERIRPRCHRGGYEGFTNVYGRMSWDQVAATITSGCTTPCRGRFGHPDRRRTTISVREAATMQSFPEDYTFATDGIEAVCEMIGNAVPPRFAEIAGRQILRTLMGHRVALASRR